MSVCFLFMFFVERIIMVIFAMCFDFSNQNFYLQDKDDKLLNGVILKTTLVQQLLATFHSLVPNNMTESFATPNIISIIIIAFVLGAALVV